MHSVAPLLYSVASLRHLFAEQATPVDVANFVLMCVALLVFASAVVYVAAMRVLWAGLRHGTHSFRDAFFNMSRFKDWAAETTIAVCTTLLLAYTFHVRHAIVERIAGAPSNSLVIEMAQRGLVGSSDSTSLVRSGAAAEAILKPLVTGGNAADAMALAGSLLHWPEPDGVETSRARTLLIALAIVMMVAYVGWELKQRSGQLRDALASGGEVSVDYSRTIKGLAAIAMCIALLLVTAAPMDDKQHLVESVLSAMKGRTLANPTDTLAANRVTKALVLAESGIRHSADSSLNRLSREDRLLRDSLSVLRVALGRVERELKDADAQLATQLAGQRMALQPIDGRVARLEARVDSGAIVVFADPQMTYSITRVDQKAASISGAGTASYRVASGTYSINSPVGKWSAPVGKGQIEIRCLRRVSPQIAIQAGRAVADQSAAARKSATKPRAVAAGDVNDCWVSAG